MRVRCWSRNAPSMALVMVYEFCFSTPRIAMHRCVPSQTTATPSGLIFSVIVARDLVGHALLQLQPAREDVDQARDLAEADHLAVRDVGDVALAEERQQVMLAHAVEVDVADDHHLAIIDAEQRAIEHFVDVR